MKKLSIKWFDLLKWSTQFFLSSLLLILAYKLFIIGGEGGTVGILRNIVLYFPLAGVIGVILGDLSLYKGKKFVISAVPILIALSFVGVLLGLILVDVLKCRYPISNVGDIIGIGLTLCATTAPPIIIYNYLTRSTRKYSAEVKEEESKKQKDEGWLSDN